MKYLDAVIPPLNKSGSSITSQNSLEDQILSALNNIAKNIRKILNYQGFKIDYDPQLPENIATQY